MIKYIPTITCKGVPPTMLILWCMIALAALLLFLKMQTVMERQKEKKANKGKQATKAGSKQDNSPRKQ